MQHFDIIIVGTGFSGICIAKNLLDNHFNDFAMLERSADVGGTWRDNNYPGAACDVPSHLYSFSFAQNPDWSRKYPSQGELFAYTKNVIRDYGLEKFIHLNHNVSRAEYDENQKRWIVTTSQGQMSCNHLVAGMGPLADAKMPDIPGLGDFKGHMFHSSQWDHDYPLAGKRVAVIGTGASAIQFVPEVVKAAGHVDVYQRTAPWLIARNNRKITALEKWLFRHVQFYQKLFRKYIYYQHELRVVGIVLNPILMTVYQKLAYRHLKKQVPDAQLRARLTPDYTIGCKRILISNDWYPALQQPNCELIDTGIAKISANGIIDKNGNERAVDLIILNTGFYATDNPVWQNFIGKNKQSLAARWSEGEEAYLGTTVSGFPNLFIMIGPNTVLGHSSMIYMIESQARHVMDCLKYLRNNHYRSIEVKDDVLAAYNVQIQSKLKNTIWTSGCHSWYQNSHGKITSLWPGFTFTFRKILANFQFNKFHYEK